MFKSAILFLIKFYQKVISPILPQTCRFYPSCSEYSRESIIRHGVARGLLLAFVRICKCNPLHSGGYDPVP
ncbi:MAG: membrane protein insertion efficiency factor YidD [Desulfuromonadaceae bacterium]|nr:membrane protein insertion efficiency factor YidD [Desulfuromonadaceae bacterium]MDD2854255.1 membrane protein insertion efficiency factor YidD [Desulfuromonadaceae bacterium]